MNRNHPRDRGFDNPEQRQRSRDEGSGRHATQGGSRAWSSGGEYLRDVPAHRDGRPDIEFEERHSGDYADNVVGGDYVRSYGDVHGDRPASDLYSENRDARPNDYSRGNYPRIRSLDQRPDYRGDYGIDEKRRALDRAERDAGNESSIGHIFSAERQRYGAGGHRGKSPKGYLRSDERIREDLNERLTDDDSIDPSEISIEVKDGIVTLTGSVEQRWMKHRAEDIAEACSGVKDVENQIRVSRGNNAA
jgi:osmotically-inducible protein OsmY